MSPPCYIWQHIWCSTCNNYYGTDVLCFYRVHFLWVIIFFEDVFPIQSQCLILQIFISVSQFIWLQIKLRKYLKDYLILTIFFATITSPTLTILLTLLIQSLLHPLLFIPLIPLSPPHPLISHPKSVQN